MNKREYAQLQQKFSGYTVLGASEDGMRVCLLSEDGGIPAGYTFAGEADKSGVVAERISSMRVNATFAFDDEHAVDIDLASITDSLAAKLVAANAAIQEKDEKIKHLEEQVKTMEAEKVARRIVDAKKAVMNRLDMLNKDRDERHAYDKKLAEEVCARCESGCFNECMNEKGEWCGDEMAVMELEAKCARAQEQMDKANAEKNKKAVSWNSLVPADPAESNNVEALMAWVNE